MAKKSQQLLSYKFQLVEQIQVHCRACIRATWSKYHGFCNAFNEKTKEMEKGLKVPVEISVYEDRTFTFITKSPLQRYCLKLLA